MKRLRGLHRRRDEPKASLVFSVAIHLIVFGVVLLVARNVARHVIPPKEEAVLTFLAPPPPPPPPPPAGRKKVSVEKKVEIKKPEIPKPFVVPVVIPEPEPPEETETEETEEPEGVEGGVVGGVEGGVVGGVVGGVLGGTLGGTLGDSGADDPMMITVGVTPPRLVEKNAPEYPAAAQRSKVEGEVVLQCIIGTKGEVRVEKVLKSHPYLEDAAVRAVKTWRYEPAIYKGRPQSVILIVRLNFTMPKQARK
jgi:protein TonB